MEYCGRCRFCLQIVPGLFSAYVISISHSSKTAIALCIKYQLNAKQRLAFLMVVEARIEKRVNPSRKPFRMIVGGPSGTGKSHIYQAIREFYSEVMKKDGLSFMAPTGVAAANIGGSTIASLLSTMTGDDKMKTNAAKQNLASRLAGVTMLVIDEVYFLGCLDIGKMTSRLNAARSLSLDEWAMLDVLVAGDEFQLTAPKAQPLYSYQYTCKSTQVRANNTSVNRDYIGFQRFREIDRAVVLDEVVRQREPHFVEMLGRLRVGACVEKDLHYLRAYCMKRGDINATNSLVKEWITGGCGAPLITYTNEVPLLHAASELMTT